VELYAALKRRSSTVLQASVVGAESESGAKTRVKIKVKGVGQECPTHTGRSKIKINVKGSGRRRPLYILF